LPIFIFASVTILMISEALGLYTNIQMNIHQNAKELAQTAYAKTYFDNDEIYGKILSDIGINYLNKSPINGGSKGIDFHYSEVMKNDKIDIIVCYQLKFPYDIFGVGNIHIIQRSLVHAWTGYGGINEKKGKNGQEIVYITPHGTVYHKSIECTHLKLSIRETNHNIIKNLRNENGEKYYCCELCKDSGKKQLFITDTGNRYHYDINCSGLKRDIIAIPISEVGDRKSCQRCGQEK